MIICKYMNKHHYTIDSFKVSNYRSFCDEQEIVFNEDVTAFYGANASGKSNIWKAMYLFRQFILQSTQPNITDSPYDPFLLSTKSSNEPLKMEVIFSDKSSDKKFRYMLESNGIEITEEAMYDQSSSRDKTLFVRSRGYNALAAKSGFGKTIFEQTRSNSLIITQAQMFNNEYAAAMFNMINNLNLVVLGGAGHLRELSIDIVQKNPDMKDRALELLRNGDFMIRDFSFFVEDIPPEFIDASPLSDQIKSQLKGQKSTSVKTVHAVRDDDGEIIRNVMFDMGSQESNGTNMFFDLTIPILDSIDNGKTIYIDEFGSSLHSDICEYIIKLFLNNKTGAKLIINTHDTSLLRSGEHQGVLDRSNILIVEKDSLERTRVTPLTEKKSIRKDDNIEKKYRYGLYGGKPFIRD